jgi:type II secretion system protein E
VLLDKGHITADQLREAFIRQQREAPHAGILEVLVDTGVISQALAAQAVGAHFRLPSMELDVEDVDPDTFSLLPEDYIRTKLVVPIRREGDEIVVGISYPADIFLIDDIKRRLGDRLRLIVVQPGDILKAADTLCAFPGRHVEELVKSISQGDVEIISDADGKEDIADLEKDAGEGPVIQYVNYLISSAVSEGASDVHIEPCARHLAVRYRIDGVLHDQSAPPLRMHPAIVSRVKIMANLDIAERRLPQDGRIHVRVQGRTVDLRVSTAPFVRGEKCVIRMLDSRSTRIGLDSLGMAGETLEAFRRQVCQPHGIVLVTGPTGSGKTTTLYSALRLLEDKKLNISTVEDPVEYELGFASQLNARESIGLTFAAALRSFLRQDPDVILVGEIRDEETARIAMQASLTGHLVLSTVHTNDAPSTITRLVNIGVEPYLIGASVSAILAQRLVRRVCQNCREPSQNPDDSVAAYLEDCGVKARHLYQGAGCDQCRQTGYKGRIGLFELLVLDDEVRNMIVRDVPLSEISQTVRQKGMRSLREDGLQKVCDGVTTVEEVLRVTST